MAGLGGHSLMITTFIFNSKENKNAARQLDAVFAVAIELKLMAYDLEAQSAGCLFLKLFYLLVVELLYP
jgi:hypothetical protein